MALLQMNFFSNVLGMATRALVVLPQHTEGQIGMETRGSDCCPALYLLHGMSDDETIWLRRTSIERYAADYELAVIMPTTHLAWYTDTAYGLKYETYLTEELPALCRSFFRCLSPRREDTFIAGLSMGGYGAFKAALGHPGTYAAAASLSGALNVPQLMRLRGEGEGQAYWQGIFGDTSSLEGTHHDLAALGAACAASGGPRPRLYQWCGTEDALFEGNVQLRDTLRAQGFDVTWQQSPGDHQWKYWDEKIQSVLAWLPLK